MSDTEATVEPVTTPAYGVPGGSRHERQDFSKFITTDTDIRCWKCAKLLIARASRPWAIKCHRCRAENNSPPLPAVEGT